MARDKLSLAQARRTALAAQGFPRREGAGPADTAALRRTVRRLGLLQIDSVNVLTRAHYLPLFARLGAYEATALDGLAAHGGLKLRPSGRRLFEYWAHEASLLPVERQPLLRWRMQRAARGEGVWRGVREFGLGRPDVVDAVLGRIREEGPLTSGDLALGSKRTPGWWGWDDSKRALEWLFWTGTVTATGRSKGFERSYDLTERVLPRAILDLPTPPEADAHRELVAIAARALGIATAGDIADYFRLRMRETLPRIEELAETGELVPVRVEGWREGAWLHREARLPRRVEARALLAPFDPVVWSRERTLRLFGFHYRIGIYTPAEKRTHGYYVLPFLLGDRLVGRVDLKTDRATRSLVLREAHLEPGTAAGEVGAALAAELHGIARWLGLDRVTVACEGELVAALPLR